MCVVLKETAAYTVDKKDLYHSLFPHPT